MNLQRKVRIPVTDADLFTGFNIPPMYGDFEAQRHWMEITIHLPITQWYFHDLQYWGLDYPPLTAYHSWLLGKIGTFMDSAWFALDSSRGIESQLLKVYMRATVLVSEYLTYIPAVVILERNIARAQGVNTWESSVALVAILLQPAIMLIDHGHFQYNTVMLGLTLAALSSMMTGRLLWGCVFFVSALCFKQMALYFAPAIFAYLLGVCVLPRVRTGRLIAIALVTMLSFGVIFAPLILGSFWDQYHQDISKPRAEQPPTPPPLEALPFELDRGAWYFPPLLQIAQSVYRIFPFARGIFEDKVANFWHFIHTFHKLGPYRIAPLQRISLLLTLMGLLPSCMTISLFPKGHLLPWAMASCAWSFFLFSFQVHEKSVLLPLLPTTILLGGAGGLGQEVRAWVGWANILGVWTLFPLLKRDELRVPYTVVSLLWAYLLALPPTSLSLYFGKSRSKDSLSLPTKVLHCGFYAAMLTWHVLEAFVEPPKTKPDLWVVLNCLLGAVGFGICALWCNWQLLLRSSVMDDYFGWQTYFTEVKKREGMKKQQ